MLEIDARGELFFFGREQLLHFLAATKTYLHGYGITSRQSDCVFL